MAPISRKYTPPPKTQNTPPPPKRGILWTWVFLAERTHFFQASIKLTHPFPAPELRTKILWTRGFFYSSGTKKEHKPKLLGPDILRWGGGFPCEGVGAEKFGMSLETQANQSFFGGISRDVAGISRRCPKSLRKKIRVQFPFPIGAVDRQTC